MKVSCGGKDLDYFLGGYDSVINCIYGPPASGKTTLCLLAAIDLAKKGGKVIFIDTETGFSFERVKQLCKDDVNFVMERVILFRIKDFDEQTKKVNYLKKLVFAGKIGLVIMDTISMYYRLESKKDVYKANKELDKQLKVLAEIARNGVPVIISNQVYTNITENKINVVGGNMLKNWSKCLIELNKGPRKIILKKPEDKEMLFEIREEGIFKSS